MIKVGVYKKGQDKNNYKYQAKMKHTSKKLEILIVLINLMEAHLQLYK